MVEKWPFEFLNLVVKWRIKIARYLVLSSENANISSAKGVKTNFDHLKPSFLDDSGGVSGKLFGQAEKLTKINFYYIFNLKFFKKNGKNFLEKCQGI